MIDDASVSNCCKSDESLPCCNQDAIDDEALWEGLVSLLIQMACTIERLKLRRTYTTSDLRKAGKRALCNDG